MPIRRTCPNTTPPPTPRPPRPPNLLQEPSDLNPSPNDALLLACHPEAPFHHPEAPRGIYGISPLISSVFTYHPSLRKLPPTSHSRPQAGIQRPRFHSPRDRCKSSSGRSKGTKNGMGVVSPPRRGNPSELAPSPRGGEGASLTPTVTPPP